MIKRLPATQLTQSTEKQFEKLSDAYDHEDLRGGTK